MTKRKGRKRASVSAHATEQGMSSQNNIVDNSANQTSHVDIVLPDEILWHVFSIFLLLTKWTGWAPLVSLNKEKRKRLLGDCTLIRNTLPTLHGGALGALQFLVRKMYDDVLEHNQGDILRVINGVASGLQYDDDNTYVQLSRHSFVNGERPGLMYISLCQLAKTIKADYPVDRKWKVILSDMKELRADIKFLPEYQR